MKRVIERDKPKAEIVADLCKKFWQENPDMEKAILQIKPHNLTRSGIQSNLYFMWIDTIRETTGESREMQHNIFRKMFLGYEKSTSRKGEVFEELRSTTGLKVGEMAEYLEQIDSLVSEYGITLPRPEEYYQAMGIK